MAINPQKDQAVTGVKWVGPFMVTFWGWTFDLYDLFTILLVTPIIAPLFFPAHNYAVSLLGTFGAYAIAYVVRPLGAAFFGNLGDKIGRKPTLYRTAVGLIITAVLLGLLPTYSMAGILAPIALIVVRLFEGFFVGGLTAGTHVIGPESVPERYRGLMSGVGFGAAGMAFVLAGLWFLLTTTLFPGSSYLVWGWRMMFFSGIFPIFVILLLNWAVSESPLFQQLTAKSKTPFRDFFSRTLGLRKTFLIALLLPVGWGGCYYMVLGLQSTYLRVVNHVPVNDLPIVFIISNLGMLFGPILGGILSQKIGRKKVSLIGVPLAIAVSFSYLALASLKASDLPLIIGWYTLINFFVDFGGGVVLIYLNEVYPTQVRSSGVAFTWNLGFSIGSFAPFIVSTLAAIYGLGILTRAEIVGIIVLALIALVGTLLSPETKGNLEKYKTLMSK